MHSGTWKATTMLDHYIKKYYILSTQNYKHTRKKSTVYHLAYIIQVKWSFKICFFEILILNN